MRNVVHWFFLLAFLLKFWLTFCVMNLCYECSCLYLHNKQSFVVLFSQVSRRKTKTVHKTRIVHNLSFSVIPLVRFQKVKTSKIWFSFSPKKWDKIPKIYRAIILLEVRWFVLTSENEETTKTKYASIIKHDPFQLTAF